MTPLNEWDEPAILSLSFRIITSVSIVHLAMPSSSLRTIPPIAS